jgi:hypothetical protein
MYTCSIPERSGSFESTAPPRVQAGVWPNVWEFRCTSNGAEK